MGEPKALAFVAAMLAGMGSIELLERRRRAASRRQVRTKLTWRKPARAARPKN